MPETKTIILILVLAAVVAAIFYLQKQKPEPAPSAAVTIPINKAEKAKKYPPAKELAGIAGYVNTDKITVGELIGKKVVLLDFWTYSCINCQRTIPYLNAWQEKYQDKGLQIIGVHTPEFKFEEKYENVARAVEQFGIKYPVALDNQYATWAAYKNRYWPRKYLIDIDGFVVYDHIGEGAYEETERQIQELLAERSAALGMKEKISQEIARPAGVEVSQAASPEIYFGASRNTYLGNGRSGEPGRQILTEPTGLKANILYLVGEWDFAEEFAWNASAGAKIIFRYRAKDVYLVGSAKTPVKVKILRDGEPLGPVAGEDVGSDGKVSVREERLYKLIQDPAGFGEHTLEMIIEGPGLQAYTFTFG